MLRIKLAVRRANIQRYPDSFAAYEPSQGWIMQPARHILVFLEVASPETIPACLNPADEAELCSRRANHEMRGEAVLGVEGHSDFDAHA